MTQPNICREKNLEKTIKEARLKARKEATKKDDAMDAACDEDLSAVESDFVSSTQDAVAPMAATGGG